MQQTAPALAGEDANALTVAGIVHGMFALATDGLISTFADSGEKSDEFAETLIANFKVIEPSRTLPRTEIWTEGLRTGLIMQLQRLESASRELPIPDEDLIKALAIAGGSLPGADLLPAYTVPEIGRFIRHIAQIYLEDRRETRERNTPPGARQ